MPLLINKLKEELLKLVMKKCFKFFGKNPTNIKVLYSDTDVLKNKCGEKEKIILITSDKIIVYEIYCDIKMHLITTKYINLDFFLRSFFKNYIDGFAHSCLSNTSKNQSSVHRTNKSDAEITTEIAIFIEKKTAIADFFFDKFDDLISGYFFRVTQFILFGRSEKFLSNPLNALAGEWRECGSRWLINNQQLCLIDDQQTQNFTYEIIKNKGNILKLDTTNIAKNEIKIKRTFYFDSDNQTIQQRTHGTALSIWKRIK